MQIGILALQGAVAEQKAILLELGVKVIEVRLPQDLEKIDGLILPGGESTTISKLLSDYSLIEPLQNIIRSGLPVLGTCAGIILLAKNIIDNSHVDNLDVLDIIVRRNAYGRQIDSFEIGLDIPSIGNDSFPGIFIRAPIIESLSNGVDILCSFREHPVAVQQDNIIGCTFHPELTRDLRFHRYFLSLV